MKNPLPRPTSQSVRLHLGLAAAAYVPLLLTQPGWVSADTKTYLYLDPSKLLSRAWSMWDPSIGLGTVTHQYIGFLWPMGPFYWLADAVGIPDWAAQRLWWGTIIFAAGAGVSYLLRTLGWRGAGVVVATFAYALSPYLLTLVARLSAILLPFAGLPWLVAFTIRTVRTKGWRYPALFALTVATCGSVNATALLLVGLAPALWLVHAVWVAKEVTLRRALRAALRMAALTIPLSAWWIAGLTVQATNGIEILRYTETARTVSLVSVSHEVLRSLGYWFFYGGDRLGPWIEPSTYYTQSPALIAVTYLLPIGGLVGAVIARWRHRAYFVMLAVTGVALAVGAYPWDDGPLWPWPRLVKRFLLSDVGLSMRSLPRAVPLVALGLAVLLGAGVTSVVRRWPRWNRPALIGGIAVALLALPPLWLGQFVPENLRRKEIPAYWREAADHLESEGDDTRVLAVPGSDFASYRWGNTVDPILPGLLDRPSAQRELIPNGSPASANLLNAFDLRFQERTADPDSVAAIARLLRAGEVLVQSDLQYERYNTPRPRNFWDLMASAPGLGDPDQFGPHEPNITVPEVQLDDELTLLTDPALPDPPELGTFPVTDPIPIVSAHGPGNALLVAGDGAGLVDAAGAALIDGTELIRYSASLDDDEITAALDEGAALLLTDSNRKRGERWTTVRHTRGYTEPADEEPLVKDVSDNRLPVFPDAGSDAQTVAVYQGGIEAQATSYGNPVTYTPEERAAYAVDGDPTTAWRTGAFSDARGERLELTLTNPATTDHITLLQPTRDPRNRFIESVRLRFDDGDAMDVDLNPQSRDEPGQVVTFPRRTFEKLSLEILSDTAGDHVSRYGGFSSLGFAEVVIGDDAPRLDEIIRLPSDLLDAAGAESMDHPLAISLNRLRQDPSDGTRLDEERSMIRRFTLPSDRSFTLGGEARLSPRAEQVALDGLLGRPHDGPVTWARASDSLTGSLEVASAAFDGDPATAWTTGRNEPNSQWVEVNLPEAQTVGHLPLTIIADRLHSVPTEIELTVDGRSLGRFPLPTIESQADQNATATVDVPLPEPATGSTFRVRFTGIRAVTTNDWVSNRAVDQPAALAEIGLPGPTVPARPARFDSGCRDDLLSIDGEQVAVRITGTMEDALARRPLAIATCGNSAGAVPLDGGDHDIRAVPGDVRGIDVDQLVLRSAAGGKASSATGPLVAEAVAARSDAEVAPTPRVTVVHDGQDRVEVEVSGATPGDPFWLVLGQSFNDGWAASIDGEGIADPDLVDGFANGWQVVPDAESFVVDLRFAPQQRVDLAIAVSVLAAVACLLLTIRRPRSAVIAPSALAEPYSRVLAFRYDGALPTMRTAVLTGAGVGLLGYVVAGPAVGLVVGVAAGLGARHETFRRWLLLASPAALGVAALYVLYIQVRHAPRPGFEWPIEMDRVHPFGWLAILLVVADVIVDRVWQARRTDT
ncbi:MAG TPA: alpha-(1-_3)-arabinofuranosyltransferase family protein [Acidimicrobiales bacterium]|nr:alpha-(1->3)-arabinofuranosyltransferase family protein [Acidimicrobiales bacterium]